jgi:uncharacterized protein (TIGR04222 family)
MPILPDERIEHLSAVQYGLGYLATFAILVVVAASIRRLAMAPARARPRRPPSPAEVAMLAGDPARVVLSSVAALRVSGALGVDATGALSTGSLPAAASRLDRAVYEATLRGVRGVGALRRDPHVTDAIASTATSATTASWLLTRGERWLARSGMVPLLALLVVGITLDARNTVPDVGGNLDGCLYLATGFAMLWYPKVGQVSRRGTRAVERLRQEYRHLRPETSPAWTTYGPEAAAMAVALWGASALWAFDASFAMAAGAPRQGGQRGSDGGAGCGGSGDGDCGGGCGGCGD